VNRPFRLPIAAVRAFALAGAATLAGLGCQAKPAADSDWFEGGEMQPASADTLQLTARVLASKGETARAGFVIDRMLREHPDWLGTYTEGAEVLLIDGRVKDAIGWLERGLERFPDHPILRNNRGMCHLLSADLAAATADFEAAYAADPGDAEYVFNLGLAKALAGDEDAARGYWSRVLTTEEVLGNLQVARTARPNFAQPG
jgi:tetratricopeptide (TPR) repeat protein